MAVTAQRLAAALGPRMMHHTARLRYYDDEDVLIDLITNLRSAGFSEFGLYYPTDPSQLDAFERIAREIIPQLR